MEQKKGETRNVPRVRISPEMQDSAAQAHKHANTERSGGVTVKTGSTKKVHGQAGPSKD